MSKGEAIEILFAEDDAGHAEIVRRNLAKSRVANNIHHVHDGAEALDFLMRKGKWSDPESSPRPHLVLLDIRMPRMDGLEVLKTIKGNPELSTIPVVMLTSSSAEIDVAKAYEHKAASYLVKPMDFEKFRELMEQFGFYWLAWNQYPNR